MKNDPSQQTVNQFFDVKIRKYYGESNKDNSGTL